MFTVPVFSFSFPTSLGNRAKKEKDVFSYVNDVVVVIIILLDIILFLWSIGTRYSQLSAIVMV